MLEGKYINPYKLEIIFGNHEKTLVALAALGGLTLVGCDNPGEVELAQREYNGKVTIRFVEKVRIGQNEIRLEINDSTGAVLGYLNYFGPGGEITLAPGKVYDLRERGSRLPAK